MESANVIYGLGQFFDVAASAVTPVFFTRQSAGLWTANSNMAFTPNTSVAPQFIGALNACNFVAVIESLSFFSIIQSHDCGSTWAQQQQVNNQSIAGAMLFSSALGVANYNNTGLAFASIPLQ